MSKVCTKCKIEKPLEEFHKCSKNKSTGRQSKCKTCRAEYNQKNKERRKQYDKIYREVNKERLKEVKKQYREANKEKIAAKDKKYREANKEKIKQYRIDNKEHITKKTKEYRQKNKEKLNERQNAYKNNKYQENIQYRLAVNLRARFKIALKNNQKKGSAVQDLGCTIDELKLYLEMQFASGMTWDNYGEWHIDHITPLSSFDLTCRMELLEAVHYTNLQPLWAEDNLRKGSKICHKN